jgi:hypothetical protein
MAKTYVLDRVAADLARGFTHPAIQRLSSLVAAYPNDLDLRRRLAAVHRRVGNRIQAGRWDYLTIGADSRDTRAFERAFPSAVARLREVRWPYRASEAATAYARGRLAKLIAAAEAERPGGARAARRAAQRSVAATGLHSRRQLSRADAAAGNVEAIDPNAVPGTATGTTGTATGVTAVLGGVSGPTSRRWLAGVMRWTPWRAARRHRVPVTVATVASAPFVAVGMVTVVEWLIG